MSQNSDLVNMPADPALLLLLLKAKSPRAIDSIFLDTFRSRFDGLGDEQKSAWVAALEITDAEAQSLFYAVDQLIRAFLYSGAADADAAAALFPSDFHSSLQQLITKILLARGDSWRESSAANQISAPRLVDFDWRVDIKTSSNLLSRMSVPTVLVGMKVQDAPTHTGVVPDVRDVQFELSKEALHTMLDGLNKIRDQLSAVK